MIAAFSRAYNDEAVWLNYLNKAGDAALTAELTVGMYTPTPVDDLILVGGGVTFKSGGKIVNGFKKIGTMALIGIILYRIFAIMIIIDCFQLG